MQLVSFFEKRNIISVNLRTRRERSRPEGATMWRSYADGSQIYAEHFLANVCILSLKPRTARILKP